MGGPTSCTSGGMSYFPHVYQLTTLPYQRGNLSRSRVGTPSSLHSSGGQVWSDPISQVKESGSLSTVSLSPTLLVPRDVTSLPSLLHTYRDGSPIPFQEVAQWGQEVDGGRADEFPFCCTQAPLSLSNFYQSLPCNNRNLQLQRNQLTRVGFSQLTQSFHTARLGAQAQLYLAWAR